MLCVHILMCVGLHVCVHACANLCICVSRPEVDIGYLPWPLLILDIDTGSGLSLSLELLAYLASQLAAGIPFLNLPHGIPSLQHSLWVLGSWTFVLTVFSILFDFSVINTHTILYTNLLYNYLEYEKKSQKIQCSNLTLFCVYLISLVGQVGPQSMEEVWRVKNATPSSLPPRALPAPPSILLLYPMALKFLEL